MSPDADPLFENFTGADRLTLVLSANLDRAHMIPGQQAAAAVSGPDWATARRQGSGSNPRSGKEATLPYFAPGLCTVAPRAALYGARRRPQKKADKVAPAYAELAFQVARRHATLPQAWAAVRDRQPHARAEGAACPERGARKTGVMPGLPQETAA